MNNKKAKKKKNVISDNFQAQIRNFLDFCRGKYSIHNFKGIYSSQKNICFFTILKTNTFFNMQRRHLKKKDFFCIKKTFFFP